MRSLPTKIKLALTGKGAASKEQVSSMLQRIFYLNADKMVPFMDATDALAVAYCHFLQKGKIIDEQKKYSNWDDFIKKNTTRVYKKNTTEK